MSETVSPVVFVWLTLGCIGLAIAQGHPEVGAFWLSALSVALGVQSFLMSGGPLISAAGVWGICAAVFVGASVPAGVISGRFQINSWVLLAVTVSYFAQIGVQYFPKRHVDKPSFAAARLDTSFLNAASRDGILLLAAGMILAGVWTEPIPIFGPIPDALTFVGVVLVGGALWLSEARQIGWARWLLVSGAAGLYLVYIFSGFGRLRLVALALALAWIVAFRWPRSRLKVIALLALPIAMFVFAQARIGLVRRMYYGGESWTVDMSSTLTGSLSAIGPVYTFAELLEIRAADGFDLAWGETFVTSILALVPRALWEDKPLGFGALLTSIVSPELAGTGHSEAALLHGEIFFNFGLLGVLVFIPVTGLMCRKLDGYMIRLQERRSIDVRTFFQLAGLACAVSGLIDLYWVGTFTFVARTGMRLIVVLAAYLVARTMAVRRGGGVHRRKARGLLRIVDE